MKQLKPIERKHDGSLPRMTPRQKQAAVKLIREYCHNHCDGNCLILDSVCSQSITYSVNCKHFRWVLLEDVNGMKIRAELFGDETVKQCKGCCVSYRTKMILAVGVFALSVQKERNGSFTFGKGVYVWLIII